MSAGSWDWFKCKEKIRTLPGRLGFPNTSHLDILKVKLDTDTGELFDTLRNSQYLDTSQPVGVIYYILHGYADAHASEPTGRLLTSKQLRGARFGVFENNASRQKLVSLLENDIHEVSSFLKKMDGIPIEFPYGDTAFKVHTLPLVPITFVLTKGDEEYPSDARIFYDESINRILDFERVNFLTHLTINRLKDAFETF